MTTGGLGRPGDASYSHHTTVHDVALDGAIERAVERVVAENPQDQRSGAALEHGRGPLDEAHEIEQERRFDLVLLGWLASRGICGR